MKVVVLGANGMLGHKLMQTLSARFQVVGTVRGPASAYARHPVLGPMSLIGEVYAQDFESIVRVVGVERPSVMINAIGLIKQLPAAQDPLQALTINALLPHRLAQLCRAAGIRLVHISTDCVFSGRKGNHTEDDISDAQDVYGRAKFLGEVTGPACLTLRTSIVGRELHTRSGLFEWFISQRGGSVEGYARAIYTGLTTLALSELVGDVLERQPDLSGVWHVSSDPITKHELLHLVNQALGLGITIHQNETVACDRSLNSSRFRQRVGYTPRAWAEMIAQMADDPTPYDQVRREHVD